MLLAEKLRTKIAETQYKQDQKTFTVTISIGLHQFAATDTISQAITIADSSLYKAKQQGRNRCILG